jgi:four helix bundle protein
MAITKFEEIESWQLGRVLARKIYSCTNTGNFARDFALRDQIRRAVGSIMHNIAEGFDGGSNAEFARFLGYSHRSCSEVQSQLYIALDQGYLSESEFSGLYDLAAETRGKIGGFIKYLRNTPK